MSDTGERQPKRSRRELSSRKAKAFEKFKQLKSGNRNKYEPEEIENIYETVDEREYTKRVLARQDDDWIVDDDGNGYVEDGRDIFDDDLDSESITAASNSKVKGVKRKKKQVSEAAGKGNLQLMLSNMPSKKKEEKKVDNDEALSELLEEIDETPAVVKPKPLTSGFTSKQAAKDYLKKFSPIVKAPKVSFIENRENSTPNKSFKSTSATEPKQEKAMNKNTLPDETVDEIMRNIPSQEESQDKQEIKEFHTQTSFNDDDFDMSQIDELEQNQTLKEQSGNELDNTLNENEDSEKLGNKWDNFNENLINWEGVAQELDESGIFDKAEEAVSSEDTFRFFWWDAYEDVTVQPGVILLFGKTYNAQSKNYVSCCVAVRNIERKLFFLPKSTPGEEVVIQDVYKEIVEKILKNNNITSFRAKAVNKKYAFDLTVPAESDYIEVRYSATDPSIDKSATGNTFCKVFGTESSFLEIFLLDRKIKGPCWLEISNPQQVANPISWCKVEINCLNPNDVKIVSIDKKLSPPPLIVASINMRCTINPKTNKSQIVMMGCVVQTQYAVDKEAPKKPFQKHYCVFTCPEHQGFPLGIREVVANYKLTTLQRLDSEQAVINYFVNQLIKIDPDLIVGHDLQGYQINILCERLMHANNKNFSKFGRIKRSEIVKKRLERILFTGRLVCDIKTSAKELIRCRSYDLDTICQNVLKLKDGDRIDLEPEDIGKMYETSADVIKLVSLTMQDCAFILKIMYCLNIIPLALQITNIAGNVMSRTLLGGRSERNEFLLLHAFYEKGYIVPDKSYSTKKSADNPSKKKPTYSGGLVLDPKVGFYDKLILLMDFNSLYPSIIQEYNICFTTMPPELTEDNIVLPDNSLPPGILPTEIRKLVESRREVKKLMNSPDLSNDLRITYHIRQMALKLTANSMYGCLGFSNSRFHAKNLAALITHKGREILMNTRDLVEKMSYEVIYGDTDSIMVNTNILEYDQVFKIGHKIKAEVNKLYKQVELDIDGVFKYLLLLKKKKYAAVVLSKTKTGELKSEVEYKGLDIVRRDWSQLASEAGKFVLAQILSDQNPDERINNIHTHLAKLKDDLENNRVPLSLLVITKQLTKNPNLYTDNSSLPHVQVALRYNKNGGHLRAGDTVPYVICEDGTQNAPTQRGYHIEELQKNPDLKIDVKYYLAQQIHPVVSRICEPIEGTDAYTIAEFLGVESNSFKKPTKDENSNFHYWENITKPDFKYRNVDTFTFQCLLCKQDNHVGADRVNFLSKCENFNCKARPVDYLSQIINQLMDQMNGYIENYYACEVMCEDPMCTNVTTAITVRFAGRYPVCTLCGNAVMIRKYTELSLYTQLKYFHFIFDLNRLNKKPVIDEKIEAGFHTLRDVVSETLRRTTYTVIDLGDVFSHFHGTKVNDGQEEESTVMGDEDWVDDDNDDEFD